MFLLYWIFAVVALLAHANAQSLGSKVEKLESLYLKNPSAPMALDSSSFKLLTEKPRNYSSFIVLTALGKEYNCEPCREFQNELGLVTQGWAKTREAARLYIGTLDFKDGQDIFRQLQIQSVPYVLHFPPSEGPHYKVIAKDFELYDLNRRGLKAEDFAGWVENVARVQIKVSRPVDYSVYAVYGAGAISTIMLISIISKNLIEIIRNKRIWISISLCCIILFCSGFMWNQIRGAPYTGAKDGKPQLIAGGFQSQFVLESQITGVLYGVSAFFIVILSTKIPEISDPNIRRFSVYVGMACFLLSYSVLLRIFKMKNGGYPFTLV
ncbi:oligosaccharyl transferase subunit ost3/OST6 [Phlyctochytrium planicorne]|nr:oligosaccharyl transferase subunit ost3/OST6 [Phlyctochytrium planicorne]